MGAKISYAQTSFLGGEWSRTVQGRFDRPEYVTAMNLCLNTLPIEVGAAIRRPGTRFLGTTRNAANGRVIKWDFSRQTPYYMEFTDGFVRFWNGAIRVTTNDDVAVTAISGANPAVVTTASAYSWPTGARVFFKNLGVNNPRLQNREFTLTIVGATSFSLTDAITGATIDGSLLGVFGSGTVARILDLGTPYAAGSWGPLRVVQAELQAVLLNGAAPQVLTATPSAGGGVNASFAIASATFKDGPYLDPVQGGITVTPGGLQGSITLTIAYQIYSATIAYNFGDYVVSAGISYQSLIDSNINNTPASNPGDWAIVNSDAFVSASGFQSTDIGRMIRLHSEPLNWAVGTAYVIGNYVKYSSAYYIALAASTGKVPGSDLTNWGPAPAAALWSWGRIIALTNMISQSLAGAVHIGTLTQNGGLNAAFDLNLSKPAASCAFSNASSNYFIGQNYVAAGTQKIITASIYPSNDQGFNGQVGQLTQFITINLRAKATAPANSGDGTLLGTTGAINDTLGAVTIRNTSDNGVTAWNYVWFEITRAAAILSISVDQVEFFNPSGGSGAAVTFAILGPPLLYTTVVQQWRLGVFNSSTYPTCGTYHEGRLWLGGAVSNRWDASVSNDIFNFAPTGSDGTVAGNNAVSYTLNAPDVNQIFWMEPDQKGVKVGTLAGEWLVQASELNSPITPTNVQAHRVTHIGCANIEPRRTVLTLVFVQRYARKIMEYFADVFSGRFTSPNLTRDAKHLTQGFIREIAYQHELNPTIWARRGDGTLIGCTYKRESLFSRDGPTFMGWHQHALGSGQTIVSIAGGPNQDGTLDALAMVAFDSLTALYHVELLTDIFEENAPLTGAWFLDDAVAPLSYVNYSSGGIQGIQFNGLWHLNGKTVTVFAGGLDLGDYVIANGSVQVPFGTGVQDPAILQGHGAGADLWQFTNAFVVGFSGAMPAVVGFTYTSQGQLCRPLIDKQTGAQKGPDIAGKKRQSKFATLFVDTLGVSLGTTFSDLMPVRFMQADEYTPLPTGTLFSGVHWDTLQDDYSFDSQLCWQVSRPYPCTIAAIGGSIQTQDE